MVKLKVCGMRDGENIRQLIELQPNYIGFIFYEPSPRFVGEDLDQELLLSIPRQIRKVGIFVNSNFDHILKTVRKYGLDWVQLHGQESPEFCRQLRSKGIGIIKAFAIGPDFNFRQLNNFKPHCDFFLFDTQGAAPGGNGQTFDWQLLEQYDNEKPFFLSGGLELKHLDSLPALSHLNLHAIDINSRFEVSPGMKDITQIKELIDRLGEVKLTAEK